MWVDFPLLNPYSSHMALPMWVQHGTMLQIPHESLMGCPYRTHINTHLWPMWVLYILLAGTGLMESGLAVLEGYRLVKSFRAPLAEMSISGIVP